MNRRQFIIRGGLALAASGAGVLGYTAYVEPHWVQYKQVIMPIRNLPATLVGKTMVQVSDLHIGHQVSNDYLISTFQKIKALKPDIMVYTGDFVSYDDLSLDMIDQVMPYAPTGSTATLGVLGNHDYGPGWNYVEIGDEISNQLSQYGVRILKDEAVDVGGLKVAGLEEYWSPNFNPTQVLDQDIGSDLDVVLCHNPDVADLPIWGSFKGWILSGHTHGGQCRPPFLPAPILPVANQQYAAGQVDLGDGRTVYINRGLGHLIKVRFNVRPEVTIFTLQKA